MKDKNTKSSKVALLYQIENFLRNKNTGEYHSHTFSENIYMDGRTYRKAVRSQTLHFYLPNVREVSHLLYEVYISRNGVSITTGSYYMPISVLAKKELELVYKAMQEECLEQE